MEGKRYPKEGRGDIHVHPKGLYMKVLWIGEVRQLEKKPRQVGKKHTIVSNAQHGLRKSGHQKRRRAMKKVAKRTEEECLVEEIATGGLMEVVGT